MNADLEQLADEAILARHDYITDGRAQPDLSDETARRAARLLRWRDGHPGLDDLAVQRQTDLAKLEATGIVPDESVGVRVADDLLAAVRCPAPVDHTYVLRRGATQTMVGLAWLSTTMDGAGPGRYVALDTTGTYTGRLYGDNLAEAVWRLAHAIARSEEIQRAGQRGDVQ